MSIRNTVILCLIISAVSIIATRYIFPRIETKTVETTKEVVRTDVQTVVHTITLPSGGTDTTTTIIDHSTRTETSKNTAITSKLPNWQVSGSAQSGIDLKPYYGIQAQRRILGPFYLGALLNTKGDVGLSIGFEF